MSLSPRVFSIDRRLAPVVFLVACCCSAAMAEEHPAVPAVLELTGVPQQLRMTTTLNFDASGTAQLPSTDNQLQFTIPLGHISDIAGYDAVVIDAVHFDVGEPLSGPGLSRHHSRQVMFAGRHHHGPASARLYVSLGDIPDEATRITAVTGRMDVMISTGQPLVADFAPLSEWIGKRVTVEGVPGAVITIESIGDNDITMAYSNDLTARIIEIEVRDATGAQINSGGSSSRSGGRQTTRTLRLQRPLTGEGSVRFRFHGPTETRQATFTVAQVPLTAAAAEPQAEAVITAQPEDTIIAPDPGAVELRVIEAGVGAEDF